MKGTPANVINLFPKVGVNRVSSFRFFRITWFNLETLVTDAVFMYWHCNTHEYFTIRGFHRVDRNT